MEPRWQIGMRNRFCVERQELEDRYLDPTSQNFMIRCILRILEEWHRFLGTIPLSDASQTPKELYHSLATRNTADSKIKLTKYQELESALS